MANLWSFRQYATVHHAHLWGTRETKYNILSNNDISTTQWTTLAPRSPFYLFTPQDIDLQVEYEQGWKITELMPINGVGITTARDHIVIDYEEITLIERAKQFRDSSATDTDLCQQMDIPLKKGWSVSKARKLIRAETDLRQFVKPIMYRPFDERLIFYHDSLVWRTVKQIMHHMQAGKNLGLSTTRSI